jgi:hypothetical protein
MMKEDLDAMMVLLADVRDEVTEAAKAFQQAGTQETPLTRHLEELTVLLKRAPVPAKRTLVGWIAGLIVAFCCGLAAGWYASSHRHHDVQAQATLMGRIDVLLQERYHALPGSMRDEVNRLYTRMGFQGPGERQSVSSAPLGAAQGKTPSVRREQ